MSLHLDTASMARPEDFALLYDARCLAHDNGSMILAETDGGWIAVPPAEGPALPLIHISEPQRPLSISYAVFCLKKQQR